MEEIRLMYKDSPRYAHFEEIIMFLKVLCDIGLHW
jgi:hypothetical protein